MVSPFFDKMAALELYLSAGIGIFNRKQIISKYYKKTKMSETFKKFSVKNKFSRKRKESSSSSGILLLNKTNKTKKTIKLPLLNNF